MYLCKFRKHLTLLLSKSPAAPKILYKKVNIIGLKDLERKESDAVHLFAPVWPQENLLWFIVRVTQFPSTTHEGFGLQVFYQDATQPFPDQFKGLFDIVKMRTVTLALTKQGWDKFSFTTGISYLQFISHFSFLLWFVCFGCRWKCTMCMMSGEAPQYVWLRPREKSAKRKAIIRRT